MDDSRRKEAERSFRVAGAAPVLTFHLHMLLLCADAYNLGYY